MADYNTQGWNHSFRNPSILMAGRSPFQLPDAWMDGRGSGIPKQITSIFDYPDMEPEDSAKFSTIKLENDEIKVDYKPQKFWGNMKEQYEAHNKDYTGVYKGK